MTTAVGTVRYEGKPRSLELDVRVHEYTSVERTGGQSPTRDHIGPWHRLLLTKSDIPTEMLESFVCSGNCVTCDGHRDEQISRYQERLEILTLRTGYLEEHVVKHESEIEPVRKRIERQGGVRAVIVLDNEFHILSTVDVDGHELGLGRVSHVNQLVRRCIRTARQRGVRFGHKWPALEKAPQHYHVLGRKPDEPEAQASEERLATRSQSVLERFKVFAKRAIAAKQGGSIRTLHFFIPLELAVNPLLLNRLLSSLGYHDIDLRWFGEVAAYARDKLAELAEERAA